ncbi:MAG: DUF4245 domain-containing protein [Micrococcales bacterium]|nr:DUF4245 domain-containing protein [Micrococcales bacterium]
MTSQPSRRSAYSLGSLPNMLRSLLVVAFLVAALFAIVPRMSSVDRPAVDAAAKAGAVAAQTGWPVELPSRLGEDWVPTVATYGPGSAEVVTFTTVWKAPGGDVSLKQARAVSQEWVARTVGDGTSTGKVTIGSRAWERYAADARGQITYLLRGTGADDLTIAVTGDIADAELEGFVRSLRVVAPTS